MSEVSNDTLKDTQDEKEVLMQRADKLGIKYSNNIGLETLRERINAKLEEREAVVEEEEVEEEPKKKETKTAAQVKETAVQKARKEALKLVRVNITSMENTKNNLSGEIFTVSNGVVGTIKRYIPFGVDWHIEQILLNTLKEKEFQRFGTEKTPGGQTVRRAKSVPAYAIQILPPLTEKELEDLRKSQLARQTIEK